MAYSGQKYKSLRNNVRLINMPIGPFEDFEECVNYMMEEEGYDEESAKRICGSIEEDSKLLRKRVRIKEKDSKKQIATGIVLEPFMVDKQGDFLTPEGVQNMFSSDIDHGVMHSVFPKNHSEIVRNEILEDKETIGGEEFPAGTWVISRKYLDNDLWQLIEEGVLNGYSMGGSVSEHEVYNTDDIPTNVTIPPDYKEDLAFEIKDGSVFEVSDVDIPAVPRATYMTLKMKRDKNILDEADSKIEFIDLMEERGHAREGAEKLWDYLTRVENNLNLAKTIKGEPPVSNNENMTEEGETKSIKEKFRDWLFSKDSNEDSEDEETIDIEELEEKVGRTLSQNNIEALMSAHDSIERALSNEVDFRTNQFTEDPNFDFSLEDFKMSEEDLEELKEEEEPSEEIGEEDLKDEEEEPSEEIEEEDIKDEEEDDKTIDKLQEDLSEIKTRATEKEEHIKEIDKRITEFEEVLEKLLDYTVKSNQVPSNKEGEEDNISKMKREIFTR